MASISLRISPTLISIFLLLLTVPTHARAGARHATPRSTPVPTATMTYEELSQRAAIGAASLYRAARNPDSFKLETALGMPDGTICFVYRAQNGFGGMNRENAVLPPNAKSLTTSASVWNKRCANKTGDDVTRNAETLMRLLAP